jgi:glutathione peroxidase
LQNQKPFKGFDESHPLAKVLNDILGRADADYMNKPDIKWNFTKFLIDREGNIVDRFEGTENLANIEKLIEQLL